MSRTRLLGIPVDTLDFAAIRHRLREYLNADSGCTHVVTLNPEYIMTARRDPAFAEAIEHSALITIDGVGVSVGLRILGRAGASERVTGVRLSWFLAELSADTGAGLFLLGAGIGVADAAASELVRAYQGARVVGTWAEGSPHPEDDERTIAKIRDSGASMLLVAYGAPAQVHWIHRNLDALEDAGVRVVIGIGGALDYISGNVPFAPPVLRKLGLEWAYRLVREPWRWRRQMVLPVFAALVLREAVVDRASRVFRRGLNR